MKTTRSFFVRWKIAVFILLIAFDLLLRSGLDLSFLLVGLILLDTFLEGNTPVLNKSFWSDGIEGPAKKQILQLIEF